MEMPVEKKESKTGVIIGTVAAIVLCGLPGLCLLCPGGIAVLAGWANYSNVGYNIPTWSGAIFLCLSVIFIAIAVVVPILLLRKKKPAELAPVPPDEPLPPVS
jgi:membrane protein implicated in regulation of membrane protease activity